MSFNETSIARRSFLKGLLGAGALVIGAPIGEAFRVLAQDSDSPLRPSIWLAIEASGAVTIVAHRSEMGTGIRTTLPMVLADELGADWSKITLEQAAGDARFGSQNTDGSRSVRRFYDTMRGAGATARLMLEQAAAKTWKVAADQCKARDHVVHGPEGKTLSFGELVATARELAVPKPTPADFHTPAERRYVGKENVGIYDQTDILTGKAVYGLDAKLDGMRHAVVWRVPVLGGTIDSFDAKAALKVAGVEKVLQIPAWKGAPAFHALGGIAVVANSTWAALEGRKALKVEWSRGAHGSFESDAYMKELVATVNRPGKAVRNEGDVNAGFKEAAARISADYTVPHLAHASMEPPCALVNVTEGKCEAWAPTQNPQAAQGELAQALGLKPTQVTVHVTLLGGGFGRKSKPDYVAEAALISKAIKAPVKVTWSREDDIRHDYYHTAEAVHVEAGVDAKGMPVAWLQRAAFPPIGSTFNPRNQSGSAMELHLGFTDIPYPIPNLRCEMGKAQAHVRVGWLRSVNHIPHAFAECSFVHELAVAAKRDPFEYLLELIGAPRLVDMSKVEYGNQGEPISKFPVDTGRLIEVAKLAAKNIGWGRKLPAGSGLGIAVHRSFLSYVAIAVEVTVSKKGKLTISRTEAVIDCGLAVNPDRVRSQIEGGAIFGASLALFGEISASKGQVTQSNFHDYRVARMNEAPREINVHIVPSEAPPSGVGEPGVPPFAPALCNAIHAATGKRIRSLPLSKHDLSWG